MNILEEIVQHKQDEIEKLRQIVPVKFLEQSVCFGSKPISLKEYIRREDKHGIIAEFKRKSPSKGDINRFASVEKTSIGYMQAGASALSILTDSRFFGGSIDDLKTARKFNYCPILRKDFIIDEYQILEAKSYGADAILLIASILDTKSLTDLYSFARSLEMEVLVEAHNEEEIEMALEVGAEIIGINNRNLKNFEVDLDHSLRMAALIPENVLKIAESGLKSATEVVALKEHGFSGFLIGQRFMEKARPEVACRKFIEELKNL